MKPCIRVFFTLSILLAPLALKSQAEDLAEAFPDSIYRAKISIIIDDFGYKFTTAQQFVSLPHALTLAIIPFTPYSTDIAQLAHKHQKEVILHAPMEALGEDKWEAGLTTAMDEIETFATIAEMLSDIPHAQGINNHGGSKLTQNRDHMDWIMAFLAQRGLYFIDSRTIASTTAASAAKDAEIAYSERDVFLDNEKSAELIRIQLEKLRTMALERGQAIGIGHPYPATLEVLTEELPKLRQYGIQLVNVSHLLN